MITEVEKKTDLHVSLTCLFLVRNQTAILLLAALEAVIVSGVTSMVFKEGAGR